MVRTKSPGLIYHPIYSQLELPVKHRYPIGKYQALYSALLELGLPNTLFSSAEPATLEQLQSVHDPVYIRQLLSGQLDVKAMRRIGFPWSEQLITRSLTSVGGTIRTVELALDQGLALHLSGGYHHAFSSEGSGFCLFNDLAVAARLALARGVDKVLIFDCDVHQGDGTAAIFADEPAVVTASLHGEKNFPARKQQSSWDLGLPNACTDDDYLDAVQQSLDYLLRIHQPDLVIYDAGIDIHQQDDLGLLHISTAGVAKRDWYVLSECYQRGIAVASVIGGGYQRDLHALTQIHLQLFYAAFKLSGLPLPDTQRWFHALET